MLKDGFECWERSYVADVGLTGTCVSSLVKPCWVIKTFIQICLRYCEMVRRMSLVVPFRKALNVW